MYYLRRLMCGEVLKRVHGGLSLSKSNYPICCKNGFSSTKPYETLPSPHSGCRQFHSSRLAQSSLLATAGEGEGHDGATSEFLSRFAWIMRKKIAESCPDLDKQTVKGMLQVIVERVVSEMENGVVGGGGAPDEEMSEELWAAVWEVSSQVLADMKVAARKQGMRRLLQCKEVKDLTRFAVEVGVRGDMLREMRLKWAREKMEEENFRRRLEEQRGEQEHEDSRQSSGAGDSAAGGGVCVPERQGKIRYKIYGLDLSEPKWGETAERVRESGEAVWPEEPKPMYGECKVLNEKLLGLNEDDDPGPVLAEWVGIVQPCRADWEVLMNELKRRNDRFYFKVAEMALSEESFKASAHDYSNLISAHAQENRLEDAERIVEAMKAKGIVTDLLADTILIPMYCKMGNLVQAKQVFESLKTRGFKPDFYLCEAMAMAYLNAGQPDPAASIVRNMTSKDINSMSKIYWALLRSYSQVGNPTGVDRIMVKMAVDEIETGLEAWKLLIKSYLKGGRAELAGNIFEKMMKYGPKPDDECTADMVTLYEKENKLEQALNLILELEKHGFHSGVATYTVFVDWLGKMQLVDEVEQLLGKISGLGEAPPLKLHISLCDMYSRAGNEKKALQAFGVLEAKKDELGLDEFERIIKSLQAGRFKKQANRMKELLKTRGFAAPSQTLISESISIR